MQTCRRHPEAGRFMATCPGCSQEQYDIEARNRAEAQARAALRDLEMTGVEEILEVQATATTLIVASRAPKEYFEFGVDVFRMPTPEECDPELPDWDRRTPGKWVLEMQSGDHVEDAVPKMIADARKYLAEIGLPVPPKPKTRKPTTPAPIVLVEFPTRPVLPATQAAADKAADKAAEAFWDHAVDCEQCLDAQSTSTPGGEHCRTGRPLAQRAEDAATVADDFARLNHWHREGGREKALENDWIAR